MNGWMEKQILKLLETFKKLSMQREMYLAMKKNCRIDILSLKEQFLKIKFANTKNL